MYVCLCDCFTPGDAPFQCQQCDAKFKINSDLKRHVRIHSGEKPYKCDFCEYRCAMKGNLKSHIQIKHGSQNSLRCPQCDFQCADKTTLRQHCREHQPIQPVQCSKCTYSCSSKGALKVHERIHSEERPFKCDFCSFASKQRSNLVIHRKKCHSENLGKGGAGVGGKPGTVGGKNAADGESPKPASSRYRARLDAARAFRCEVCNASFVREDSLRSHRKQHRETHNGLQLHLSCQPGGTISLGPGVGGVGGEQGGSHHLQLPLTSDPLGPFGSAQLKIIVSHPLGQEDALMQAAVVDGHHQAKANMVLLSPSSQDLVVNSMIQQVNLLTPAQPSASGVPQPSHCGSGGGGAPEAQAILLTPLGPRDAGGHVQTQTFITTCSDIESLSALIQEGGTEVTVVTEGIAATTASSVATQATEAASKPKPLACVGGGRGGGGLLVPDIHLGGQGVVLHSLPLIVSSQPHRGSVEPLPTSTLYTDSQQHIEGLSQ